MGTIGKQQAGCNAGDCERTHYAKGFCKKHYMQVFRHGKLTPGSERGVERPCEAPGCSRTDTAKGLCRKHNRQMKVYGRLTPEKEYQTGWTGCKVEGCNNKHRAKGLCAKHYNRSRRGGLE